MRAVRTLLRPTAVLLTAAVAWMAAAEALPEGEDYGGRLTLARATPLAEVLREPARFAGEVILVRGRISDVCQKKGCWTVLRDGDGAAAVRVDFRDYGFFLPRDSTGAQAWAQGRVSVVTLSRDEARHYAAESRGGAPGRIEGPRREVRFTADAVRLVRDTR